LTEPAVHVTPQLAARDLTAAPSRATGGFWLAVVVLAVLGVVGLAGLAMLASGPAEPRARWGYAAAVFAFLFSTFQAAPALAFMTRLAKGFWGIGLRRAAEIGALAGLVTTPLFIVIANQLPVWHGRNSIWFDWPGAPQLWDAIAVITLTVAGLGLLYLTAIPDFAASSQLRGGSFARALSLGWSGTQRQWKVLSAGAVVLGAFYLMMYVIVTVFIVSDLAMSLVPGWGSSVMPPYFGVSSLQAGLALTLLIAGGLRRFGGMRPYIRLDAFWGAAKPLLAMSLLFFYFTWSEIIIPWYGRTPKEQAILELLMFGPYLPLFIISVLCNFVLPFFLLIWNPIRVSIGGPILVAAIIVFGNFIDRIRIFVASWSVAGPPGIHQIEHVPPPYPPGIPEVLIMVGAVAAVGAVYLLALKLIPGVSVWETQYGLLLKEEQPYMRTEVAVVAKPR
jgi:Ni/Fe-hydrogenase subunit HybB-like protein